MVPLKKAGQSYIGCCPFHAEKTPSFHVNPQRQCYHCFGCGAHGDAIDFICQYEKLSFKEAVEKLAAQCGLVIPEESRLPAVRHTPAYDALVAATEFYMQQLQKHPAATAARHYLSQRGITLETCKRFQIGFAPPGWNNLLISEGNTTERQAQLLEVGLLVRHDTGRLYDRFRARIMFPIRDRRGRVIGFGGRVMDAEQPKYLNSPESAVFHKGDCLYGIYETHIPRTSSDTMFVVEGYLDVITLHQAGLTTAVATLGTAISRAHLEQLFREKQDITFCFDGDSAGRQAAWAACELILPLMEDGRQAHFLFLPEGEDPDSYVRHEGAAGFLQKLKGTRPLSEYLFETLSQQTPLLSIDSCARFVKIAKPLLEQLPQGVFRDMMFDRLFQMTYRRRPAMKNIGAVVDSSSALSQPEPAKVAIALLRYRPDLIAVLGEVAWLSSVQAAGVKNLVDFISFLRENASPSVEALAEYFALMPAIVTQPLYAALTEQVLRAEFLGAMQSLARLGKQQLTDKLLAKAQSGGLSDLEKNYLRQLLQSIEDKC